MYLEKLSNEMGVSGNEGAIRKIIVPAIRNQVDDVSVDTMGNVYAYKAAKSDPNNTNFTVMVTAHMDEVGFIITKITADGMLRFKTVGGFDRRILPGKTVMVGKDKIPGVIGAESIQNLNADQLQTAPGLKAIAIDIGAHDKEAAMAKVSPGDYATFDTRFSYLNGDPNNAKAGVVKGKALDNRAGCAMLIELLKQDYPVNIVGVFTVQEEIGLRGAHVAAHKINPDMAIVLECMITDDLPLKGQDIQYPRLGHGPCGNIIDRVSIINQKMRDLFEATGIKHDIPYQFKRPNIGGTDAGAIQQSRMGVPTMVVATPGRYIHGPVTLVELADFWRCIKLVSAILHEAPKSSNI